MPEVAIQVTAVLDEPFAVPPDIETALRADRTVWENFTTYSDAYQRIRTLSERECEALPMMLRATALRFWLSRLHDKTFPVAGDLTFSKDPAEFKRMLLLRRELSL